MPSSDILRREVMAGFGVTGEAGAPNDAAQNLRWRHEGHGLSPLTSGLGCRDEQLNGCHVGPIDAGAVDLEFASLREGGPDHLIDFADR